MAFKRDSEINRIVDHGRKAVLKCVMGHPSGHKDWEIDWNGEVFGFTGLDTITYGGERKNTPLAIEWVITSMKIPESMNDKRDEIMAMIKEALEAEGLGASFKGSASVKFSQCLIR
ncbi:MAG: hypothetical protein ABW127_00130 [Candidatus Thiodiazotropha endolucinida]